MARTPIAYRYVRGVRKMRGKRLMQGRVWRANGNLHCYIYRSGKRIRAIKFPGDGYWLVRGGWEKA